MNEPGKPILPPPASVVQTSPPTKLIHWLCLLPLLLTLEEANVRTKVSLNRKWAWRANGICAYSGSFVSPLRFQVLSSGALLSKQNEKETGKSPSLPLFSRRAGYKLQDIDWTWDTLFDHSTPLFSSFLLFFLLLFHSIDSLERKTSSC